MENKLLKNLQSYLLSSFDIPVIIYDINEERPDPPLIILGINDVNIHPMLDQNATVNGYCMIGFRGTQDPLLTAGVVSKEVTSLLKSSSLYSTLNAPISGTDSRPCSAFNLDLLTVTGNKRIEEEYSLSIFVEWEAFIADADM